jgi:hypothetical protein
MSPDLSASVFFADRPGFGREEFDRVGARRNEASLDQDVDQPARLMAQQPDHAAMHGSAGAARGSEFPHTGLLGRAEQGLQVAVRIFCCDPTRFAAVG